VVRAVGSGGGSRATAAVDLGTPGPGQPTSRCQSSDGISR